MKWTDVGQLARNFLIWKRNTESLSKMEKQISQEKKKSPALLIWSEHNQFLELQFSQKQKIVIPKANKREHVNWSRCHVMAGHFSPYFFPIWSAWIKPNYKYWYHHAAKAIRPTFWFKFNKRDYFMFRIITKKKRWRWKNSLVLRTQMSTQRAFYVILLFRDVKCSASGGHLR